LIFFILTNKTQLLEEEFEAVEVGGVMGNGQPLYRPDSLLMEYFHYAFSPFNLLIFNLRVSVV